MNDSELNKMMGSNLRKLRRESKLTQEQLAERLQVSGGLIPKWESGAKGIGKKVLVKLCAVFKVQPYMFCRDERIPLITNTREQEIVYKIREAEKLGVSEHIEQYCTFIIGQARNKQQTDGKNRPTPIVSACVRPVMDALAERKSRDLPVELSRLDRNTIISSRVDEKRGKNNLTVAGKG